ncbi:hypothetical protein L1277_001384 [Okibacterium sp. HSC-33S16]|uniref:hypothetical protein n=1 Tax=Okibacterium sp. HSC-33S16 TaxID=2910965 RepID=UPI00209F6C61|nr:hypothetical protein [Okibacterium sp. HSC-33S16]MCP2031293.1 hypothetical protein [Okibacterium sp. HSC-33S16]
MSQVQAPHESYPQPGVPAQAHAPAQRTPLSQKSRVLITWALVFVLLLGAVLATIGALNRDVYGPGSLVRTYLSELASQDAPAALALPGVKLTTNQLKAAGLPEASSDALLRGAALSNLTDISEVADENVGDGVHEVTFSYEADGVYGESTFVVAPLGTRFPLIPTWTFEVSPLAVLNLSVEHTTAFTVNDFDVDTRAVAPAEQKPAFDNIVNLQVFTPGRYTVETSTEYLQSDEEKVLVDVPATVHEASVAAEPTDTFVDGVQEAVNKQLDTCAEQVVLQPTGCPFGIVIDDRVDGDPAWSMDDYPEITLEAGSESWVIPTTTGSANIEVDVQSLFDGSITHYDDDVDFSMTGHVYLLSDGSVQATVTGEPTS